MIFVVSMLVIHDMFVAKASYQLLFERLAAIHTFASQAF